MYQIISTEVAFKGMTPSRIVTSVFGAESFGLADAYNGAVLIQHQRKHKIIKRITI